MEIKRKWAMPSKDTFTIKPIKKLLNKYVGNGKNWIDPFCGLNSPAEITNDHNPEIEASFHLEAEEFGKLINKMFKEDFDGILFDPPYSGRQVKEHYKVLGKKVTQLDTSRNFYSRVINPISRKIKVGGYAISFGWNSGGFGKKRGFEIIEILLVPHGGHHNDTIVTVEKKVQNTLEAGKKKRKVNEKKWVNKDAS